MNGKGEGECGIMLGMAGRASRRATMRGIIRPSRAVLSSRVSVSLKRDVRGRLVSATTNGVVSESYAYDANGNRLGGEYDAQDRQLAFGGETYAYDLNGSMTNRNGVALTWNLFGRLMSVGNVSYWRDEQQRLCSKEVGGEPVKDWMWSGSRLVAEYDSAADEISVFVYAGATAPAYMIRGGVTYRIVTDNQGSVRLVVHSETGEVAQRLDYDSFGRVLCDTNPGFQPFGFQGGLYDPDTGLVEFGCRWYDAETGRWISKDPIGLSGGLNLYEFCKNNPILYVDPSGTNCISDWWEEHVIQPISDGILSHWNRNDGLNELPYIPNSPEAAQNAGWKCLTRSKSVYHNRNGASNSKYVSPDGHFEAVFDSSGNLVTDSYNVGTYNIYGPDNAIGHFVYDMLPYYLLGNSPDDAFNYWDRIKATCESIKLKIQGK